MPFDFVMAIFFIYFVYSSQLFLIDPSNRCGMHKPLLLLLVLLILSLSGGRAYKIMALFLVTSSTHLKPGFSPKLNTWPDKAEALFQNTQVNITTQGRPFFVENLHCEVR